MDIKNGRSTFFWQDKWLKEHLTEKVNCIISIDHFNRVILKYIMDEGNWDVDYLKNWFPKEVIHRIFSIVPLKSDVWKDDFI